MCTQVRCYDGRLVKTKQSIAMLYLYHDDFIKWRHSSRYRHFVRVSTGHWPVTRSFDFSICTWTNCWSLRCSWSIACRRCSNYIFILDLALGFNMLHKDKCQAKPETFQFGIWCALYYRFYGTYWLQCHKFISNSFFIIYELKRVMVHSVIYIYMFLTQSYSCVLIYISCRLCYSYERIISILLHNIILIECSV